MRNLSYVVLFLLFLSANLSLAQTAPQDPLESFVNACVLPKLEGSKVDYSILEMSYKTAPKEHADPLIKSFLATSDATQFSLEVEDDINCSVKYSVRKASPFGREFGRALSALKKRYYQGQMGPPSTGSETSGLTAISMYNPDKKILVTVVYSFKEDGDNRNVFVYTTKK